MKKLLFGLIAIVLQISAIQAQSIPLTNYGFYHNEGLDAYYKIHSNISEAECSKVIPELSKLLKIKYPQEFSNLDDSEIINAFIGFKTSQFNIISFWNLKKNGLYSSGNLSPKVGALIDNILNKNMDVDEVILEIKNFRNTNSLTQKEKESLIVFENVLNSSNTYWKSSKKGKPGSQAIIADGLGALMFCYSGPGAIIAGMACSLFVNEAL